MSATQAPQTLLVETMDDFVRLLTGWHTNKVALLTHLKEIPEGSEVSLDAEEPKVLAGEYRAGFIMGLAVALEELGKLPFEAEVEEVPPSSQEANPHQQSLDLEAPVHH